MLFSNVATSPKSSLLGISLLHWLSATLLLGGLLTWLAIDYGWLAREPVAPLRVAFDPKCDLRAGPCMTTLDNGARVSFGIEPRSIPVAKTLDVEVRVKGLAVKTVMLDINGVNMKMPPNRVSLKAHSPGLFKGQAGLMFCTLNAMEWETVVELTVEDGEIHVPYRFITVRDGNYE